MKPENRYTIGNFFIKEWALEPYVHAYLALSDIIWGKHEA